MESRFGRQLVVLVALGGGLAFAVACGAFGSDDGPVAPPADAGTAPPDGPTNEASDPDASIGPTDGGSRCPSGHGATMVEIVIGNARFCVDSTEATRRHYADFLDSAPIVASQSPVCLWNTSFLPVGVDMTQKDLPIVKVDWCDARAFCSWAGKRLCGSIADGGALPSASAANATESEWMAACSHNGTRLYPYGSTSTPANCVDEGGAPRAVGSTATCVGGYAGLFDMAGNVTEWENACTGLAADGGGRCMNRGGSYKGAANRCAYTSFDGVTGVADDWGIRCCATPTSGDE